MGLVRFGSGITQISGAVGGDVHARNRFGNYIRPRTKPVNPHSARQEDIRAKLSFLAEHWHSELSGAERAAWEVYAAAVPMKNRLGETIYLTGYNHFMRTNGVTSQYSPTVQEVAPTVLSLPEKDPELVVSAEDIAGQTFSFTCDVAGWAANGDEKFCITLYQGLPQLHTRNFFAGPWRYMDRIDATEGAAGTGTYAAVFPFGEGQKIWFNARLVTVAARITKLWQLPPHVVLAD